MERLNHCIRCDVIQIPSRRRDGPVPELFGDDPNIDAFGPQFGGVGVSEAVGVHALGDTGLSTEAGKEDADVAVGEGATVEHAKDRISPVDLVFGSNLKPSNEPVERLAIHTYGPRSAALGEQHADGAVMGVQVLGPQRQSFVDPQARTVEDGDQGVIADLAALPQRASPT